MKQMKKKKKKKNIFERIPKTKQREENIFLFFFPMLNILQDVQNPQTLQR